MFPIRVKTVQESDLRMLGSLARNIQRVLPVTQADIDAAAALGKGWVVWKVFEVSDPLNNLRGGTQLIIRQNSIQPGQNVRRVIFVVGPGGQTVVIRGTDYIVLPDAIANSLSYVKAFGGTEQRNIPQPYTQVNYVTNTAQTAIDTGVMIDFAKNYEFEVECRAVSGSWYILQSRASSSGNLTGIYGATSGSTIILVVGNVTVCTSAITRTVGNKLYVKATLNAGTATLYVKDETTNTEDTQTGSYGTSQPNPTAAVYLLGNAGGQYVDVNSDIYMARIKENGVTVVDYVPARQVATAGFYDTVSGTFKTALTPANLSADGNTVPTPDAPMDIVSNNGVLKTKHQSGLPLGYTLLEYIQTSGTQYIDTGVKGTQNTKVELKTLYYTQSSASGAGRLFGSRRTNEANVFVIGANGSIAPTTNMFMQFGTNSTSTTVMAVTDVWMTFVLSRTIHTINGVQYGDPYPEETFETPQNLKLMAFDSNGSIRSGIGRCAYCKIWDGNELIRNFLPVIRNEDNVVGMYDVVNDVFYTNAGTDTFTGGPAVSDPAVVYADSTVETIEDTIGNAATAEMLLKVGDYQDVQSILDGVVTRNVGAKVLNGTEGWTFTNGTNPYFRLNNPDMSFPTNASDCYCTHFEKTAASIGVSNTYQGVSLDIASGTHVIKLRYDQLYVASDTTVAQFKAWLAAQYANGTPVIIIYPLATPTTESVAGQTLQVTDGDNMLEIVQAALTGLELEAQYQAAVSLTIQEVEDANLDNNVTVTIQ